MAFKPMLDRIDKVIERAASRGNPNANTLERALNEPAIPFVELFPPVESFPSHFGTIAKSLWTLTDELFKAADPVRNCPPGFESKSVQVADIYVAPITTNVRTSFLVLWARQEVPVMVPCPEIPSGLLEPPKGARLDFSRDLLRCYVDQICGRLNVIAPAALMLGASDEFL